MKSKNENKRFWRTTRFFTHDTRQAPREYFHSPKRFKRVDFITSGFYVINFPKNLTSSFFNLIIESFGQNYVIIIHVNVVFGIYVVYLRGCAHNHAVQRHTDNIILRADEFQQTTAV